MAAGGSSRMGRPKPRLSWRGRTFVAHAVALADAVGAAPIVVVQGAATLDDLELGPATLVHNAAWSRGPLGSLQTGLAAVPDDAAVLVLTVDRPHVEPETVRRVVDAWRGRPDALWQPRYADRHGHPILYPADLAARLRALPATGSARDVVHAPDVTSRRAFVDVDDPAVIDNLDRPEDLKRLP
jgi:CTP:molybdopterin cytidylyltransferase MocA